MSVRILLLATVGLIGFSTSTEAKLSLEQCTAMCGTANSCKGAYKHNRCNTECAEVLGAELCGGETVQAPTQLQESPPQIPTPTLPKRPLPEKKPTLAKAEEMTPPPVATTPTNEVPEAEAVAKATPKPTFASTSETPDTSSIVRIQGKDDAPPPPVELAPLDPTTDKFFKEFSSDIVTVGNSLKCLTKSITVDSKQFSRSFISKVQGVGKANPYKNLPYKAYGNYEEYQKDMGQYFESMISLNIMEAFQQWTKNSMKAQAEFQGLIQRGIRFAEGVAKKIPGYNPSSIRTAGADMMGPYLYALPDAKLEELNKCISSNSDDAHNPTLKNFYGYFLKKIESEKTTRKSRGNEAKIQKAVKKLAK